MSQTEITVQIFEDIKSIEQKLISLGFSYVETLSGEDNYFSISKEIENLTYEELLKNSIIVRSYQKSSSNSLQSMIVHKDKIVDKDNNTIGENKISINIDNSKNAISLFENAGLTNWLNLKQINHFYKKDEVCIIVGLVSGLDGCFMEIEEYPSIKMLSEIEKFEILKQFAKSFNFNIGSNFSCKKCLILYNKNRQSK